VPSTKRQTRLVATAAALAIGTTPLLLAVGADAAAPTAVAPRLAPQRAHDDGPIKVDLLAINDFHGQLEKASGSSSVVTTGADPDGSGAQSAPTVAAGGAAYLGWHLGALRAEAADRGARTVTVAAGDLIGATPLLSAAFHDEPTIETMNLLGLDITSVGNHEFDEGWRELVRMQNGGCKDDDGDDDPYQDSCPGGKSFEGADFQYLSANVIRTKTGETVFPAFQIERVGRAHGEPVKMAFVGMTLEDTPNVVTASGVKGLEFIDEVEAVKRVMPELRAKGIKSVVVLLHEGGTPTNNYTYNGCADVAGAGADIARTLPAAVDVVVSGHTHQAYNCVVQDPKGQDRLFTSAFSLGRIVTDIALEIDRVTGDVIRPTMSAENHVVTNSGPGIRPRAGILDLIARYSELVAPIANQVLGKIAPADAQNSLARPSTVTEDYALGNLIADSQLSFSEAVPEGGETADIAFMNPGGIRASLVEDSEGNVTYGAAFAVQPFNNFVSSITLTGQQVLDVLNQQWNGRNESRNNILQVAGIEYSYDKALAGQENTDAVVPGTVLVDTDHDGEPETALDPTATYRVVANNFLADGGDGFPTLAEGTDRFVGGLDIDALAEYLAQFEAYQPTAEDRITVVNP
jgi:5'-nucleotidase